MPQLVLLSQTQNSRVRQHINYHINSHLGCSLWCFCNQWRDNSFVVRKSPVVKMWTQVINRLAILGNNLIWWRTYATCPPALKYCLHLLVTVYASTDSCPQRVHAHTQTHTHTQSKSKAFWLSLSGHAYPVTSTGAPVHYSSTQANPPGARLVTHRRLNHISQVRVWAPKVPPGSSPTMQDIDSWHLLHQFYTNTHMCMYAHTHT